MILFLITSLHTNGKKQLQVIIRKSTFVCQTIESNFYMHYCMKVCVCSGFSLLYSLDNSDPTTCFWEVSHYFVTRLSRGVQSELSFPYHTDFLALFSVSLAHCHLSVTTDNPFQHPIPSVCLSVRLFTPNPTPPLTHTILPFLLSIAPPKGKQ